ncbi:MAG TPA: DNA replication and repair protein RecF [Candidatus Babeliales bacterium]|nr:DNA replication and repair protein RecF [Candidatus Babeliales bacterium]HLC06781.1 DNA replication and repair protein RecF [Candidatus Babeliales bacterium]
MNKLQLASIYLKDFRCFEQTTIDLDSSIVLICGANGTGKTSLLEALYYGCYLRSFRTHLSRDLVALGKESFFVKFLVKNDLIDHTIQIGFAHNKRLVKVDNKTTVSYKDLLSYYRVVSLTEDDLKLIQDGPEERRAFMDQALLLDDASFLIKMREYRVVLENRNALLQKEIIDKEEYFIWTKKLWEHSLDIQEIRKQLLAQLEADINTMLAQYIDQNLSLSFVYQAKKGSDLPFERFLHKNTSLEELMRSESYFKRSLFGAHVDDFSIVLEGKKSRAYASRGQQKMIVLLIKIAQIKQLMLKNGPIIFLLDDFMTDFDVERGKSLLSALFELNCQLIFTSPRRDSALESALIASQTDYKIISM